MIPFLGRQCWSSFHGKTPFLGATAIRTHYVNADLFFWNLEGVCVHAKLLQSCLTLHKPMACSPPGSSVHWILQAKILEWVAMPFSRGSSQPRDWTCGSYVSCIGRWVLYHYLGSPWDSGHYVNWEAFKCSLSSAGVNNSTLHPPQAHLSALFVASPKEKL